VPLSRTDRRRPPAQPGSAPAERDPRSAGPDLARAAWGAACLLGPGTVGRLLAGHEPDTRARRVLRVLGARHLVQAAGMRLLPAPVGLVGGTAVDGLHAVTALLAALADPRRRRAELADALVATGWCLWSAARCRRLR